MLRMLLLITLSLGIMLILPNVSLKAQSVEMDIDEMIDNLYQRDSNIRSLTREKLLSAATQSQEIKQEIMVALIKVLTDQRLSQTSADRGYTWDDAAYLVARLEGLAAIQVLVAQLNSHPAAFNAIKQLGLVAQPSLIALLSEKTYSVTIRLNAAQALAEIADQSGWDALVQNAATDPDEQVRQYILLLIEKGQ